jgi:thiamine pyrophosphokinase|tara:strand:+ start:11479 stop:12129 length:651 start_codon:yes stop_codon:yes gene_type:complete
MDSQTVSLIKPGGTVVLADGKFPQAELPRRYLFEAEKIICCDGAVGHLENCKLTPSVIVGDMDSISHELKQKYSDRIIKISEQETNDLTKAITWAADNKTEELVLLGAAGKRIDHTIGNASLLAEHCNLLKLMMVTDEGFLLPITKTTTLSSKPGQQISIFSLHNDTRYTSKGLKYPLNNTQLPSWWSGSLNEALSDAFTLKFDGGPALIYLDMPA